MTSSFVIPKIIHLLYMKRSHTICWCFNCYVISFTN